MLFAVLRSLRILGSRQADRPYTGEHETYNVNVVFKEYFCIFKKMFLQASSICLGGPRNARGSLPPTRQKITAESYGSHRFSASPECTQEGGPGPIN